LKPLLTNQRWIFVLLAGVAAGMLALGVSAQWKTYWSYDGPAGPEQWGDLTPDYAACKAGKEQSPIDIESAVKADLPALKFDYNSGPLKFLIDNGYTIRVNYHDAPGAGNFLTVGETRYHLTQWHFHRPSEEKVHGHGYDMVAHFVHDSSDGKAAAVAVMIKTGRANPMVQKLFDNWPKTKGKEQEIAGVEVNPGALLPHDLGYYTYQGSLTAPPCTEGVTWFVLKTPVEMSAAQIEQFAKMYPSTARPVQALNGRVVKETR
jgi:carbonic anhydrase